MRTFRSEFELEPCPACAGNGREICPECGGESDAGSPVRTAVSDEAAAEALLRGAREMLDDGTGLGLSDLEAQTWRMRLEGLSSDFFVKDQVVDDLRKEVERRCQSHGVKEVRLRLRELAANLGALREIYRRQQ